jgi:hypothetical protein
MLELDKKILSFIEMFHAANTKQIQRAFYKSQKQGTFLCERKLRKLYERNLLKRHRIVLNEPYIYYFTKSKQITHHLIVTELYCNLLEHKGNIISFEVEEVIEDIRPDAICQFELNGDIYQYCIEVHISNNNFDQIKYERFYRSGAWKKYFKIFPAIVIISDRKVNLKDTKLIFIQIGTAFKDIDKIFI